MRPLGERDITQSLLEDRNRGRAIEHSRAIHEKLVTILPKGYIEEDIIGHGVSSMAWQVRSPQGDRQVLKIMKPGEDNQAQIHIAFVYLAQELNIPVGRIIQYGQGWCIEELVTGEKITSGNSHYAQFSHELGEYIARLHNADISQNSALQEKGVTDFNIKNEIAKTGKCRDKVMTKIGLGNWGRMWNLANQLIPDILNTRDFVPCHSDMTPGNVFINDKGHITGIIDFGAGCLGPRELELASIYRMQIMEAIDFAYYDLVKSSYNAQTNVKINEDMVRGLTIFKCLRKVAKGNNSIQRILLTLKNLMQDDFREEEINPLWQQAPSS